MTECIEDEERPFTVLLAEGTNVSAFHIPKPADQLPDSLGFTKVTAELMKELPDVKRYGVWLMIDGVWMDFGPQVQKAVICDYNSQFGGSILGRAIGRDFDDRITTDPGGALRIHSTVDTHGELWLGCVKQRRPSTLIMPSSGIGDLDTLHDRVDDSAEGVVYNAARGYAKVQRGSLAETPSQTANRESARRTGIPAEDHFDTHEGTEVIFSGTTNNANIVTRVHTVVAIARHLPFMIFEARGDFIVPSNKWLTFDESAHLAEEIKGLEFRRWFDWTADELVTDYMTTGAFFSYLALLRREGRMSAFFS